MDSLIEQRKMEHFNKFVVVPEDENSCWGWNGIVGSNGRAIVEVYSNGKPHQFSARKISYQFFLGITDRITMNTCNNPLCCNPKHVRNKLPVKKLHIADNKELDSYRPASFESFLEEKAWTKLMKHVVVVKDDCWGWKGAYNSGSKTGKYPRINVNFLGIHIYFSPRRYLYKHLLGKDDPTPANICGNPVCCNPDHRKEVWKWIK